MLAAERLGVVAGGRWLLTSVSLAVRPGELMVVLGPNGAGKSTLLACLSGALEPATGSVKLDGRLLRDVAPAAMAQRRAVLSQANVVSAHVYAEEIVALGRVRYAERRAQMWMIVGGAMRAADADTFIGRSVPTLSGGEQQRVHLARALAQIWPETRLPPRYLLLDEPTSSLDLAHQAEVMAMARGLADLGHGVLAVVHDLNLAAATADRMVLLDAGRLVAEGAPRDVVTVETIARVFGVAADVLDRPDGRGPFVVPHTTPPRTPRATVTNILETTP